MGAMKRWAQDIHDDCLANGAYATAKKHNMSIEDVKSTTLNAAGWETLWIDFVNHHGIRDSMRKLDSIAKKFV